ncbi:MAG: type Z 30S ribosomal protein S14 [Candidatus Gracilibacteria bacterium]|jgi:small subunit ribosomal protein S14
MAKLSLVLKTRNRKLAVAHRLALGLDPKPGQAVRMYNRCGKCGRVRGYMRRFNMCRICFRELARKGAITGLTKSSW